MDRFESVGDFRCVGGGAIAVKEWQPVPSSHLLRTKCVGCGTETLATPAAAYTAKCGPCRGGGVVGYVGPYTVPAGYPMGPRPVEVNEVRAEHPAPEIPARFVTDMPGPVKALSDFAQGWEWAVRVAHARGNGVHGSTGRPTAVRDSYAVHMERPGRKAVAVYAGGTWGSMWLLPDLFRCPTLADLKGWLAERGEVQPAWYADIRARVEETHVACVEQAEARKFLRGLGLSVEDICTQFGLELEVEEVRKILAPAKSKKEGAS